MASVVVYSCGCRLTLTSPIHFPPLARLPPWVPTYCQLSTRITCVATASTGALLPGTAGARVGSGGGSGGGGLLHSTSASSSSTGATVTAGSTAAPTVVVDNANLHSALLGLMRDPASTVLPRSVSEYMIGSMADFSAAGASGGSGFPPAYGGETGGSGHGDGDGDGGGNAGENFDCGVSVDVGGMHSVDSSSTLSTSAAAVKAPSVSTCMSTTAAPAAGTSVTSGAVDPGAAVSGTRERQASGESPSLLPRPPPPPPPPHRSDPPPSDPPQTSGARNAFVDPPSQLPHITPSPSRSRSFGNPAERSREGSAELPTTGAAAGIKVAGGRQPSSPTHSHRGGGIGMHSRGTNRRGTGGGGGVGGGTSVGFGMGSSWSPSLMINSTSQARPRPGSVTRGAVGDHTAAAAQSAARQSMFQQDDYMVRTVDRMVIQFRVFRGVGQNDVRGRKHTARSFVVLLSFRLFTLVQSEVFFFSWFSARLVICWAVSGELYLYLLYW